VQLAANISEVETCLPKRARFEDARKLEGLSG
jgi:hypothetical protein